MDAAAVCRALLGDEGLTNDFLSAGAELMAMSQGEWLTRDAVAAELPIVEAGLDRLKARVERIVGHAPSDDEMVEILDALGAIIDAAEGPLS